MSMARMAAYRAALGERFRPDASLGSLELNRGGAEKLLEALAEAVAADRENASSNTQVTDSVEGLRLGAGFGAQAAARMAAEIGAGVGAEADLAQWAARGFGASVLSSAAPALLLGREAVIVDPVPALISAGRTTPGGWSVAARFVASAVRTVAALVPAVEAGAARLVDPTTVFEGDAAARPAPEPRARRERAMQWAQVVQALGGGGEDTDAFAIQVEGVLAEYDAARRGGVPFDPMYGPAAGTAALTYPQMVWAARLVDLRLGADLADLSLKSAHTAVAEALWAGPAEPEAAPRLDSQTSPIWRLDLGPAPDPARLSLTEAAALRLGEEALAAQREVAAMALTASAEAGPEGVTPGTRVEIEDAAAAVSAGALVALSQGAAAEAFQAGWRAELLIAPGCGALAPVEGVAEHAAAGLAALAEAWPELALIVDLSAAQRGSAPCGAAVWLRSP